MLTELLANRDAYLEQNGERCLDAVRNARLVQNAERYYRVIYYAGAACWNLRDQHMFDTLEQLLRAITPSNYSTTTARIPAQSSGRTTRISAMRRSPKWLPAANTARGERCPRRTLPAANAARGERCPRRTLPAANTARGEHSLGQLCRARYGSRAFLLGFGTHTGTVAAASHWGGAMQVMNVRPSHVESYERLCHDSGVANFFLPLRPDGGADGGQDELVLRLTDQRRERAIGVICRPDSELASHYFKATLPRQFDEYIWLDRTRAVTPLDVRGVDRMPDIYPFGL